MFLIVKSECAQEKSKAQQAQGLKCVMGNHFGRKTKIRSKKLNRTCFSMKAGEGSLAATYHQHTSEGKHMSWRRYSSYTYRTQIKVELGTYRHGSEHKVGRAPAVLKVTGECNLGDWAITPGLWARGTHKDAHECSTIPFCIECRHGLNLCIAFNAQGKNVNS